jgi:hypothetical protein
MATSADEAFDAVLAHLRVLGEGVRERASTLLQHGGDRSAARQPPARRRGTTSTASRLRSERSAFDLLYPHLRPCEDDSARFFADLPPCSDQPFRSPGAVWRGPASSTPAAHLSPATPKRQAASRRRRFAGRWRPMTRHAEPRGGSRLARAERFRTGGWLQDRGREPRVRLRDPVSARRDRCDIRRRLWRAARAEWRAWRAGAAALLGQLPMEHRRGDRRALRPAEPVPLPGRPDITILLSPAAGGADQCMAPH